MPKASSQRDSLLGLAIVSPDTLNPEKMLALKGKNYAGVYCYELGSGDRVYYRVGEDPRQVVVYYAAEHPSRVPLPPAE